MCCLFGIVDNFHILTKRQKTALTRALAKAAEERGTDAAGIAFNTSGFIHVNKSGCPAHKCHFAPAKNAPVIMGHTRYATQGKPEKNYNNHPFLSTAGKPFALAHNGVLYNDYSLEREYNLPYTNIETDSYVAVQLLELFGGISFDNIKKMAEAVSGSFVFTILDNKNRLYIVKGDNPLTIYKYNNGVYIYASTKAILEKGLVKSGIQLGKHETVEIIEGDILRINRDNSIDSDVFKVDYGYYYSPYIYGWNSDKPSYNRPCSYEYQDDSDIFSVLYQEAERKGYTRYYIEFLFDSGYSFDEICDKIYRGEDDIC